MCPTGDEHIIVYTHNRRKSAGAACLAVFKAAVFDLISVGSDAQSFAAAVWAWRSPFRDSVVGSDLGARAFWQRRFYDFTEMWKRLLALRLGSRNG
jgi:hypothetical protein